MRARQDRRPRYAPFRPPLDDAVPQDSPNELELRRVNLFSWRSPAPPHEFVEKRLVDRGHDARRSHGLSAARGHHCRSFCKMLFCTGDDASTGLPKSWMGEHLPDVGLIYTGLR